MTHFEKKHAIKLSELGVKKWLRFVDDIFATLNNKDQAEYILSYLNRPSIARKHSQEYI